MANYKWEVDTNQSGTYILKDGNNTVGTVAGLRAGLTITEGKIDGISVADSGAVTINSNDVLPASPTKGSTVDATALEGQTLTLVIGESVTQSKAEGYEAKPSTTESGTILIKQLYTAGWYLDNDGDMMYTTKSSDRDTAAKKVTGLRDGVSESDYDFDNSTTITLKASAFKTAPNDGDIVAVSDTGFHIALSNESGKEVTQSGKATDTAFSWDVADPATATDPATKVATLQKVLTPGWEQTNTSGDTSFTYKAERKLTYATIEGLASTTKDTDLPNLEANAEINSSISLPEKVLPTTEGKFAELKLETKVVVPGIGTTTEVTPNFTLTTNAASTAVAIEDSYETKVEVKTGETTATATVSQMMSEYWEPGTDSDAGKKLTYHASKANAIPLAKVTGLKADAAKDTDVTFNTMSSIKTITLKSSALDASVAGGTTVELDVSGDTATKKYALKTSGVTAYNIANHGNPDVTVEGTTAAIKVKTNEGWTLGTLDESTHKQALTYTAPADVTVATISGIKSGTDKANIVISGNTVTLKKAALPDSPTAGTTTVTLAENSQTESEQANYNPYTAEYDFTLALDTDVDNKYGAGTKTPKLGTPVAADINENEPENTKTVKIYVDDAAGWKVDEANPLSVTFAPAGTTDWFKITGLSKNVDITAETGNISLADKTVKIKKAALAQSNVTLVNLEPAITDTAGYKLNFDGDVTEPGSDYRDDSLEIYFPTDTSENEYFEADETTDTTITGKARVRGTLVEGWSLTDDNTITYTAEQKNKLLAEITGLSDDNTAAEVAMEFGNTDNDKNVLYLKLGALQANSNVTLTNKTLTTTDEAAENPKTLGTCEVAFKLSLKAEVDGEEVVENEIGHDHTYAWDLSDRQTDAYYKEGTKEGWTLTDDKTHVTYDAEIAPKDGTTLLTVSGLKGGDANAPTFTVGTTEEPDNSSETISAVTDGINPLLYISKKYVPAVVIEDNPETESVDESEDSTEAEAGLVHIDRRILNATEGKAVTLTNAAEATFGKYELAPFNDATDLSATYENYVPTKPVDKYIWTLDDADLNKKPDTTSATYRKVTAEYWDLGTNNSIATYHAQTEGEVVARITGIAGGLAVASTDTNPDFYAAQTHIDEDYVIADSFITDGSDTVIVLTVPYKAAVADDPTTAEKDESEAEEIGVITISEGALAGANVTFVSGGDKHCFSLDSGVDELEYADPTWEVNGTTATYRQTVSAAGYALTDFDTKEYTGTSIIYNENTPLVRAKITGLKEGIQESGGDLLGVDEGEGVTLDLTGDDPIFKLNGNVLGSTTVKLENVPVELTSATTAEYEEKPFKLAIGAGALDKNTDDEDLQDRIENGVNVWRLTKNKGEAVYKTVKPSYYTLASDGLSITNTPENNVTIITTLTGLSKNIAVKDTAPDNDDFISTLGYIDNDDFDEGLAVTEPAEGDDPYTFTVLKESVLDANATASISNDKAVFEFDTGFDGEAVEIEHPTWNTTAGTAVLTADTTEGWSTTGSTISHYSEGTGRVIATIRGLKSDADFDISSVSLPDDPDDFSFKLSAEYFDKKPVTLTNGTKWDGTKFTYGLALDNNTKSATAEAQGGVARWYLKDDTTLNYSLIYDAHYEDNDANSDVAATTITYVEEKINATPIISITNLANTTALNATDSSKIVNEKYYKDSEADNADGTPVAGITISGKNITVGDEDVVFKDEGKPLMLGGSDTTYKFVAGTDLFKAPVPDQENFKVEGTEAKLYSGDSEGYGVSNTKVAYMAPVYDTIITTISGIKSGLEAGHNPAGTTNKLKDSVGYYTETDVSGVTTKTFVPVITYDTSSKEFTLKKGALAANNVTITGTGTLTLGDDLDSDNLGDSYVWKVNSTNATYNKGKNAGWDLDGNKTIKYHTAVHDTVVATLSGLASGLKVDPEDDQQILDKNGNVAIAFNASNNANDILLRSNALTTKNVLFKRETVEGTENVADSIGLYQPTPTTANGVTTYNPYYVYNKVVAGKWDSTAVAGNKASYTVETTAGYDLLESKDIKEGYTAEIAYTKAGKVTSTITGLENGTALNDSNKPKDATNDNDETTGTFTFAKAALANQANVKLTNGKGNNFTLKLNDVTTNAGTPVWNFNKGTATYTETYTAGSYLVKTEGLEYTYVKTPKTDTIFTITGLDKTQFAESPESGKDTEAAVAASHGITLTTVQRQVATGETNQDGTPVTESKDFNVIRLDPTKVKFAASNVVIKKGTQEYEFDLDATATAAYAVQDYANEPQWGYNKGTATLDAGKSQGWAYKSDTDHTTLTYAKAKPSIVATVKGLNATNLVLADGTEGTGVTKGKIYYFTEDATGKKTYSLAPVIEWTNLPAGSDPGTITLTDEALVEGKALKDKVKVTLSLPKNATGKYVLSQGLIATPTKDSEGNKWSIDTNGVASYQYDTFEGWELNDKEDTLTYAADKTTVLAKIGGLTKDTNGTLDITTYTKNVETGKFEQTKDKLITEDDFNVFIKVTKGKNPEGTKDLYTFTIQDFDNNNGVADNKYLTTSNVTLTQVDKTSEYEIYADTDLAPTSYSAKWTVDGKAGKATYTAGKNEGYENGTGSKAGKAITYVKPAVSTTYATITGLKKDATDAQPADKLETAFSDTTIINVVGNTIEVLKPAKILSSGDKATTVTLSSKEGYTFAEPATNATGIANPSPTLTFKNGTVNVVKTAAEGTFTMSADRMKIVYNKKATDTILATVKGLNKDLNPSGTNKLVVGSTDAVTLNGSKITLSKDALANSNITFTLGKGVEEGEYSLKLDDSQVNKTEGIMTNTGNWSGVTGWVNNNGTASYKTYNLAYYSPDGKGGYKYNKETKGDTYATITGLDPKADVSGFGHGGEIKLDNTMVVTKNAKGDSTGKNITLKNSIMSSTPTNFTLALDTTSTNRVTESGLDSNSYAWDKGKLTVTQKAGYTLASDTSITYLAKDKEKQLVATLNGIDTSKNISFDKTTGVITLNADNLAKKNVTLTTTGINDINYTLNYSGAKNPAVFTSSKQVEPWSLKGTTATFTGYVKEDTYTVAASGKSITYTKANGTDESPKALTTIKGVTAAPTGGTTSTIASGSATLSSGLLAVSYGGNNITGSKDADTITLTNGGSVTVNAGKGDDLIKLGSAAATIVYANNDGFDVINDFSDNDKIKISGVAITADNVTRTAASTFIEVGKGSIELRGYSSGTVAITDKSGTETKYNPSTSSDVLLADNNYSQDAAALSDIVEPFHASYTPYDFESGLDLVKKDSFAPAFTYTGDSDKK